MDGDELVDDELAANIGESAPCTLPACTRWKAEFLPPPMRFGSGGGDEFSLDEIGWSSYLWGKHLHHRHQDGPRGQFYLAEGKPHFLK
jgi:hypothetical protein